MNPASKQKFAVVTGASSGIGYELAKTFASEGYNLLIAAEDDAIHTAAQNLGGDRVQAVQCDLATHNGVDQLYEAIKNSGHRVDAIALNAGVGVSKAFVEESLDDILNLISLNVTGLTHLAHHVLKDMVARNTGRVLFTASVVSTMPGPFEAVYAASKAFVLSLSDALREELKDTDVTVTALMPGATETNFFHRAGLDDTRVGASEGKDDPADVARMGYEGMMQGDAHVIAASWKSKLMGLSGEILPEKAKAMFHAKLSEPGSAKKKSA